MGGRAVTFEQEVARNNVLALRKCADDLELAEYRLHKARRLMRMWRIEAANIRNEVKQDRKRAEALEYAADQLREAIGER